jgi:energy-coupling factor transporter ATP-binding protein EcfA2
MYIREVIATNFGPFENIKVEFRATGLNIIEGSNASGKTQLAGAILAAIIGRSALRIDQNGKSPSSIAVVLAEQGYTESVSVVATSGSVKNVEVIQNVDSVPLGAPKRNLNIGLLAAISDIYSPNLFLDFRAGNNEITATDIHQLNSFIPEELGASQPWKEFVQSQNGRREVYSEGEQQAAQLIRELALRWRYESNIPLIIDDNLWGLDQARREFAFQLIHDISQRTQVLLFTTETNLPFGHVVVSLDNFPRAALNLISYNGTLSFQKARLAVKPIAKFLKGQRYPSQENRICEFKEVKGKNPISSIKSVVDQYVVAYLNSGEPQNGKILWGVRDDDRSVVGVSMTDSECDELRCSVTDKLHQITPEIAPTAYRIELHTISDGAKIVPNLYLVEVTVPSSRRTLLFATGSQEVYVKTDAGKKKLSAVEIQQELLRRCGIDGAF